MLIKSVVCADVLMPFNQLLQHRLCGVWSGVSGVLLFIAGFILHVDSRYCC